MDIPRKSAAKKRRVKRILYSLTAVIAVAVITVGVSRLQPAAPSVDKLTLWKGTVARGTIPRNVRGMGTLVPEEIRYVPAISTGRIEKRLVQPGAQVKADTVLFELTNPEIEQAFVDAESQLRGAAANLTTLRVQLDKTILDQEATLAQAKSDFNKAKMQYEVNDSLGKKDLKSKLEVDLSRITAEDAENRVALETKRLAGSRDEAKARMAAEDEKVRQLKDAVQLKRKQMDALKVRAGIDGQLQIIAVQVGQQVTLGQELARVANPKRLKAELKVNETQAKDIQLGQSVSVDTRVGLIAGRVIRIDPSVQNGTRTVDASLEGELPKGAVPDLSVDGTIELEKLENILYVNRPVRGQEHATVGIFKVDPDGAGASQVQVKLGRGSVTTIEVLEGLREGDVVILSDTSQWDSSPRIRLN
ncbi:MAG TPA: HlyD family efflux transporter periplasmic adaptor subunit [Blastocatellia bacterium]|nr:HlyD family efflux transporter periplasmic adaptor subunit [Blastocatellia bacterium]